MAVDYIRLARVHARRAVLCERPDENKLETVEQFATASCNLRCRLLKLTPCQHYRILTNAYRICAHVRRLGQRAGMSPDPTVPAIALSQLRAM